MRKTLAIETSCDDTSLAIVTIDDGFFECEQMLSFSQIDLHAPYGGVVPELAYRSHADKIVRMIEEMKIEKNEIDFISVTSHPGLPGSLVVWVTTAHMLWQLRNKEVVEVNHIMGHVFSVLIGRSIEDIQLPYLCLTVSGWHNDIYIVEDAASTKTELVDVSSEQDTKHKRNHLPLRWSIEAWPYKVTKIAQTLDDAAGEVYDKVSRMLGGPYPWGYWMDCQAAEGWPDNRVDLGVYTLGDKPLQFSFSWVKSQVYNLLRKFEREGVELDDQLIKNIAWKFQKVVLGSLVKHIVMSYQKFDIQLLWAVGWVAASSKLQGLLEEWLSENSINTKLLMPIKRSYCTDNGAMVWVVGHILNAKPLN